MPVLNQTTVYTSRTEVWTPVPTLLLLDAFPSAIFAFSFRKLREAYAGSAVRIRRSSDSTEQDIGFSGNDFDSASAASFIGGGSGFIVKWYDQSGNAYDHLEATTSKQPTYVASGIGSKPAMDFVNASGSDLHPPGNITTGAALGTSTKWSCFVVGYITNGAAYGRFFSMIGSALGNDYDNAAAWQFSRSSSSQAVETYHNGSQRSVVNVTYGTGAVLGLIFDGANATTYKDAVAGTSGASSDSMGDASTLGTAIGRPANGTDFLDGRISELVVWKSDQTSNVTGIDTSMGTNYGL